jgi:hypothetical protein
MTTRRKQPGPDAGLTRADVVDALGGTVATWHTRALAAEARVEAMRAVVEAARVLVLHLGYLPYATHAAFVDEEMGEVVERVVEAENATGNALAALDAGGGT